MRKAKNANKSFLAGTAVLFVGVFAVVLLFLFWSYDLLGNREERIHQDVFQIVVSEDFRGMDLSVWLNDSLIASHAHAGDTLVHNRLGEETSVLVVDNATDRVTPIPVAAQRGVVLLRRGAEKE